MRMDFQNVNPLNVRLNMISGNLLPMTADDTPFPILWRIYSVLMWLLQIVLLIALIFGCMNVSIEKVLKDALVAFAISAEIFLIVARLHNCKNVMARLIRRINDILSAADDTMKNVVTTTLKPVETPLMLYWIAGMISVTVWSCLPLMLLFRRNVFYYEDYRLPAAFFAQPLPSRKFVLGSIVLCISSVYMFIKKVSMDVYMVHMVMLITAQYRYTALKIAMIFRERDENKDDESWKIDSSARRIRQMKTLCRHHNALIHITSLLKELLSLNFSLIYLNSVMRFCAMGIMISITTSWERMSVFTYTIGALVQLYILCSSVQQLLDASTEVTDEAFHQEWYLSRASIRSIFMLLITANNLECKVAMFENFNLSLSSFMMILNHSYTVALLFLRMK